MIHSSPKMLHEEKWRAALLSEPAVGEANPAGFNELRGGRDVSVCHVSFFPFCAHAPIRCFAGKTLRLSHGPVVLTMAAPSCEDENPTKKDAPKYERWRDRRDAFATVASRPRLSL
jgi:hypothetical protein